MNATYPSIDLIIQVNPPESQRKPGHHVMSYQWQDGGVEPWSQDYPVLLQLNNPFTFFLHDYTKSLSGPTLKVMFEPFPAGRGSSPFNAQDTADLRSGVTGTINGEFDNRTVWRFGPFTLANEGIEFEFSMDIDDPSGPQKKWYVDPQMIVEGSG